MNKKTEWSYVDKWSKKIRAINYLGGKCAKCGNDNIFHLSFHHLKDKEFNIFDKYYKWSKIVEELDKCELLCKNCHHELHTNDDIKYSEYRENKQIFLDYKGSSCEQCGYDKNNAGLVFHHINENEKMFAISEYPVKNIKELDNLIKSELDKCQILCQNCHNEHHTNIEKFNLLKDKIYYKVDNYYETKPYLNREEIYKMYDSGVKQIDIAKHFNTNKSGISDIIKYRNKSKKEKLENNNNKPTYEELVAENENINQRDLSLKYGVNRNTIRRWLKKL